MSSERCKVPSYSDIVASRPSAVAGYTRTTERAPPDAAESERLHSRPQRNRQLPARLDDYVRH